jgi:hypothetical protein
VRESEIETALCERVENKGGIAYKFVSPSRNGVPDRLLLYPIAKEHIDIVARYVHFVETKAPGKKPKPWQDREHKRLKKMGFIVEVLDHK